MTNDDYAIEQQALAAAWKKRTPTPGPPARAAGTLDQPGRQAGRPLRPLPARRVRRRQPPARQSRGHRARSTSSASRGTAASTTGPGNNLLSSQVQCVNALMPMVHDPERISPRVRRPRSTSPRCSRSSPAGTSPSSTSAPPTTSTKAPASRACAAPSAPASTPRSATAPPAGTTEFALVEWKYTEKYTTTRKPNPGYDKTRIKRYGADYHDPAGPLRSELDRHRVDARRAVLPADAPALLAWRLEQDRAEGADVVRVLHVLPPDNRAYQESLVRPEHRALWATPSMRSGAQLLRTPDRFRHVDPAVFLAESITSWDYVDRYSPTGTGELPWGVSVWRDTDERIVAAAYVYEQRLRVVPPADTRPGSSRRTARSLPRCLTASTSASSTTRRR